MTVQELIDTLSCYDPQMKVGIIDRYADTGQNIGNVYRDTIDRYSEEEVVYLEGGQLL